MAAGGVALLCVACDRGGEPTGRGAPEAAPGAEPAGDADAPPRETEAPPELAYSDFLEHVFQTDTCP